MPKIVLKPFPRNLITVPCYGLFLSIAQILNLLLIFCIQKINNLLLTNNKNYVGLTGDKKLKLDLSQIM